MEYGYNHSMVFPDARSYHLSMLTYKGYPVLYYTIYMYEEVVISSTIHLNRKISSSSNSNINESSFTLKKTKSFWAYWNWS